MGGLLRVWRMVRGEALEALRMRLDFGDFGIIDGYLVVVTLLK